MDNAHLRHRIHQTFRIQLLRDMLLPRALDDGALNLLTNMTFVNQTNMLSWLLEDNSFMDNLYVGTCSPHPSKLWPCLTLLLLARPCPLAWCMATGWMRWQGH